MVANKRPVPNTGSVHLTNWGDWAATQPELSYPIEQQVILSEQRLESALDLLLTYLLEHSDSIG